MAFLVSAQPACRRRAKYSSAISWREAGIFRFFYAMASRRRRAQGRYSCAACRGQQRRSPDVPARHGRAFFCCGVLMVGVPCVGAGSQAEYREIAGELCCAHRGQQASRSTVIVTSRRRRNVMASFFIRRRIRYSLRRLKCRKSSCARCDGNLRACPTRCRRSLRYHRNRGISWLSLA